MASVPQACARAGDGNPTYTAFSGVNRLATGDLRAVVRRAKVEVERDAWASVLVFDDETGAVVDVDYRGTWAEVTRRLRLRGFAEASEEPAEESPAAAGPVEGPRGPGRPRLGVVAREVTLLPRHWEWLNLQPGGASVALRKLVDEARRLRAGIDRTRRAQEAAYRFLSTLAGNEPGFEEATRALFAGRREQFEEQTSSWPKDVREHAGRLAAAAFGVGMGERRP